MKRLLTSAALASSLLFGHNYADAQASKAAAFDVKRCVNMGNALDAPKEGDWGHVIEERSFKLVKEAGFDTVRIPIRWSAHTGAGPDYKINETFFTRVTNVINQALAQDLKVIINVHHFEELNEDPEANFAKFIALWKQIAPRYAGLPETVYFEVLNEPNGKLGGDIMRRVLKAGFEEIRKTNPTRILILGGEDWSGIKSVPSIPQIDDDNQVYTIHYYDPFKFTHQKASWTDLENSGRVNWGSRADKEELKRAADYAKNVQRQTGVPLFVGEMGAYEKAPYDDVVKYTEASRKAFEDAGLSWCVWNFTATFPFYDSNKREWDQKKLAALGLSETGVLAVDPATKTASAEISSSSPFAGQSIDDAFNTLRRQVGREVDLLMSPYADSLPNYGPVKVKLVEDAGVPSGEAQEVKVSRKAKNPWDGAISGPLTVGVKKGDAILMSYWAKVVKGAGVISSAGLQENFEPYTPLTNHQPDIGEDWKQFFVSGKAKRDYKAGELGFTLQVTGAKQTLRIGPVFVANLGQNVALESLPN